MLRVGDETIKVSAVPNVQIAVLSLYAYIFLHRYAWSQLTQSKNNH
jgi:hypothetical protein